MVRLFLLEEFRIDPLAALVRPHEALRRALSFEDNQMPAQRGRARSTMD